MVEVTDGEVTLTGTVANPEVVNGHKRLAEQVQGVAQIVSRLRIL